MAAPLLIRRAAALEDDAFPPVARRFLQQIFHAPAQLFADAQVRRRVGEQAAEQVAPLLDRARAQVLAIQPQQVEGEQQRLVVLPLLDQLEARDALPIEDGDLAVHHRVAHHDLRERARDGRESRGEVQRVAGPHGQAAVGDRR